MDRRVTSPTWGSPPLCKQALRSYSASSEIKVIKIIFIIMLYKLVLTFSILRVWIKFSLELFKH